MSFLVVELRHGPVGGIEHAGATVASAIGKARASGPLALGPLGFAGDSVADRRHHGGPDKAVCVYAAARYDGWQARYGAALPRPAFGENVLAGGVDEGDVCVGDVYELGGAVVEVSQPRVPCYKPAAFTGEPRLTLDLRATGWTGWYLRVRQPGTVVEGDEARLVERPQGAISVARLNALRYADTAGPSAETLSDAALEAASEAPGLTDDWRKVLLSRRRT
jgi:MOSC domain-containing protein YiiM